MVYLNLDEEEELKSIFQNNKNPIRIIELHSFLSCEKIEPEDTLLVFDEVQECPEALNTLKSFPVGKVTLPLYLALRINDFL